MNNLEYNLNAILIDRNTNLLPENLKKDVVCLGIKGTLIELNGQDKSAIPSVSEQVLEPDKGYNAMTRVTINAVDSSIDGNIQPENIKKDITILGITGTFEGAEDLQEVIDNQDQIITELQDALKNKAAEDKILDVSNDNNISIEDNVLVINTNLKGADV